MARTKPDPIAADAIVPDTTIYQSEGTPGDVRARLSFPTLMGAPNATTDRITAALEIIDELSGEVIVNLKLDPKAFVSFMSGSAVRLSASHVVAHPERLGRRSENTSTAVHGYDSGVDARAAAVVDGYRAQGWEEISARRTNYGRLVVARRWVQS